MTLERDGSVLARVTDSQKSAVYDRMLALAENGDSKLYKMAFRNVFRDKKRALLVFASLFWEVITFISANSFFGSMDLPVAATLFYRRK